MTRRCAAAKPALGMWMWMWMWMWMQVTRKAHQRVPIPLDVFPVGTPVFAEQIVARLKD